MTGPPDLRGPAVAVIGERLLDRVELLAMDLTALIRGTEPFYNSGGVVPAQDLYSSVRDNLVHILSGVAVVGVHHRPAATAPGHVRGGGSPHHRSRRGVHSERRGRAASSWRAVRLAGRGRCPGRCAGADSAGSDRSTVRAAHRARQGV